MATTNSTMKMFEGLANNPVLKVVGRVGMALSVAGVGLFMGYLTTQANAIQSVSAKVDQVSADTSNKIDAIKGRVDIIDTRINIGQKAREDFQTQMLAAAADTQHQLALLSNQNASIAATLAAMVKQVDGMDTRARASGN